MYPPTTAVMDVEPHLRRLGLAQVLPKGGPREDERRAERGLRQAATGFHHPELVLLFGRPDVVIPEHAAASGYDIVLTAHPDPILSARLTKAGRVYCCGDQPRLLGPGWPCPARWYPDGTEALTPSPTAGTRPARTV